MSKRFKMKFYWNFKERRSEDGMKYSSLESRLLGDVFKSTLENDNLPGYDGMLVTNCVKCYTVESRYNEPPI